MKIAAPTIASAPIPINTRLSAASRPIVMIVNPAIAKSNGRSPHRRHAGVRKNASGIAASITIAYSRNQREPGTLIPSGASSITRHTGHFGSSATSSDEHDDDSVADKNGLAGNRGTISPILRRICPASH